MEGDKRANWNARRYSVKHGVHVYGEGGKNSWFIRVSARNENWELKAATSWQVRRSDCDGIELIKCFAGRACASERQPSTAILTFRKMLKREREYDHQDDYSVPIGSRYHPERAALWAPDSPVETTEVWLNSNLQEA